jgi:glycosyltransferase involved in cell wall biosynthesis
MISVILPSDGDIETLDKCLKCLEIQTISSDHFEVIVVFNVDETQKIRKFIKHKKIRHGFEPRFGSYAARNKGLGLAKGSIVAFTDADCLPETNWLEEILKHFKDNKSSIVGGRIDTFPKDSTSIKAPEYIDLILAFNQELYINKKNFSATANLAIQKNILTRIGNFNEKLLSGGDKEWGFRATNMGFKILYRPSILVKHPARIKLSQHLDKRKRIVRGVFNIHSKIQLNTYQVITSFLKCIFPSIRQIQKVRKFRIQSRNFSTSTFFRILFYIQLVRIYGSFWSVIYWIRKNFLHNKVGYHRKEIE